MSEYAKYVQGRQARKALLKAFKTTEDMETARQMLENDACLKTIRASGIRQDQIEAARRAMKDIPVDPIADYNLQVEQKRKTRARNAKKEKKRGSRFWGKRKPDDYEV